MFGLGWVQWLLRAVGLGEQIVVNEQQAVHDQKERKAGQDAQRAADQESVLDRASEQNRIEEDFDRLSGDDLADRVRKSME